MDAWRDTPPREVRTGLQADKAACVRVGLLGA